jgi:hypothetical protein
MERSRLAQLAHYAEGAADAEAVIRYGVAGLFGEAPIQAALYLNMGFSIKSYHNL